MKETELTEERINIVKNKWPIWKQFPRFPSNYHLIIDRYYVMGQPLYMRTNPNSYFRLVSPFKEYVTETEVIKHLNLVFGKWRQTTYVLTGKKGINEAFLIAWSEAEKILLELMAPEQQREYMFKVNKEILSYQIHDILS